MSYIYRNPWCAVRTVFYAVLWVVIAVLPGCDNAAPVQKKSNRVLQIGVVAPMSGPDRESGENALLGIQTAVKMQTYLNNGDRIELVVEDNESTSAKTRSALEKLSSQKEVAGILLMAKSDLVLDAVPIAERLEIPIIALIATHPDVARNSRFISQMGFDDIFQGTVAALYVRDEMLIDTVAVFSDPGNAHYTFLANEFVRKFSSVGGNVAAHITEQPENADLEEMMEGLKRKEVQMLYLAVSSERVIQLVKIVRQIGWRPEIMGTDGLLSTIILNHREKTTLIEGIIATDFYSAALPKTEYGRKAVQLFSRLYSHPRTSYTGLACEGTSILIQAMNQCSEKTDRLCINYSLRHTEAFEGLFGKISIQEDGRVERPVFVNIIDGQHMKFLVKVY